MQYVGYLRNAINLFYNFFFVLLFFYIRPMLEKMISAFITMHLSHELFATENSRMGSWKLLESTSILMALSYVDPEGVQTKASPTWNITKLYYTQ